jgi:hypothetical protein
MKSLSLRGWLFITTVVMAMNIFLALTLVHFAPKVQVVAQFFSPNVMNFGQLTEATSFNGDVSDKRLIDEMLVRYYIHMRHEFIRDKYELSRRWGPIGPVARLSFPNVYQDFSDNIGELDEKIKNSAGTSSPHVTSVSRFDNIFTVDFDVYEWINGGVVRRGRRAVIRVVDLPERRGFWFDMVNPYGLTVQQYNETEKKGK